MSTYAEWAETHESDINGSGWGSDHLWHYESTPSNATGYKCARCFWNFAHYYNRQPNIFTAMQESGVPDKCARTQLWPVRLEYASTEERERWAQVRAAWHEAQPSNERGQLSVNAGTARTDGPRPDGQGEQA